MFKQFKLYRIRFKILYHDKKYKTYKLNNN